MTAFMSVIFSVVTVFNIYSYTNNAYVRLSENGAVIIYDKDMAVIIDADDKSDCYFINDTLSARNFESAVVLNSDACKKKILKLLPEAQFDDLNDDYNKNACNHIGIEYDDNVIFVSVFDKVFKIDKDYVKIGEYTAYRNIYEKFNENGEVMFIVTENAEVQIKEGK